MNPNKDIYLLRPGFISKQLFNLFHLITRSQVDRAPSVNPLRRQVKDSCFAITRFASRCFDNHGHGEAFVQETEFGRWVEENTAIEERAMELLLESV